MNQNTHLVIDIGNIHDKPNIVLEIVSHYSPDYIRTDIVPSVPQMGIIIHSRTASIPRDLSVLRIDGYKGIQPSGQGVVDPHRR